MRTVALILLTLSVSCASAPPCANPVDRDALVRRVTPAEIRSEYLTQVEAHALPEAPRRGVEEWIDREIAALVAQMQPGDEIWYYTVEKCCGWYSKGYYLLRGRCIAAEINTWEDM